jgi:hypothetical protein
LASQLLLFHQVQFAKLPTPHHQVANLPSALYCLKCSSSCAELEFYNLLIFWADGWNWLTKWNFFLMQKTWPQAMDETNLNRWILIHWLDASGVLIMDPNVMTWKFDGCEINL